MGFKKGQSGNPAGKKKGTQNRITRTVKEAFVTVFNEIQDETESTASLLNWAKKNPDKFYPLAARLIPTETNAAIIKVGMDLEEEQYEDSK